MTDDTNKTEQEMLDQWTDMATGEGDAAPAEGAGTVNQRVLDQNEIDSLLGLDPTEDKNGVGAGIRALLDSNIISYERLPTLNLIFDKFERLLSTSMRQFTADNVDISIENMTSVRFGEYLNTIPLPSGMVAINAVGLEGYILMVYESRLIYAVVDVLLGGRKAKPAKVEGRQFSTIEISMIENLTAVILRDLGEAFSPVAPIEFVYERMESNPRFVAITPDTNACILVSIRMSLEGREGIMYFCLPYATLEPVREQLLQQSMGEKFGHDNIWENHLAATLYRSHITVKAVIAEKTMRLNQLLKWRLGDTIPLDVGPNSSIIMKCEGIPTLSGKMGKMDGRIAVKVYKTISDLNLEDELG